MTPQAQQELLTRRAAALARPVEDDTGRPVAEDLLVVEAAGARYAVQLGQVRRVLRGPRTCRLPAGCGQLLALAATGGGAVPLADLAALLQQVPADPGREFVVVVGPRHDQLGLLVDAVDTIDDEAARRPRPLPDRQGEAHPAAVGLLAGDVLLLDVPLLLDDDRLRLPTEGAAPEGTPLDPDTPGEP